MAARPGLWVFLLVILVLTVRFYTPRRHGPNGFWRVLWRFDDWRLEAYKRRKIVETEVVTTAAFPPQNMTETTKRYRFGPFDVWRIVWQYGPDPLGTNALHVGDLLFDPSTKRELWQVVDVERKHEFDDDTVQEGVLVRSSINGGESWMPREKLRKALVGR